MSTTILGLAPVLPAHGLDNHELERRFGEREMQSIAKMSGINQRRVVRSGQCASDLALTAAERLLTGKGFDRTLIDLLIFASITPDYRSPTTASVLHSKLALSENCATFDVNQACSAYPYALSIAHSMIAAGTAHYALVLNAETLTHLVHPMDRSLVSLHSDGACATLVGPCSAGYGLEGFLLGTDGTGAKHIIVPAGGCRQPSGPETQIEITDASGCTRTANHLHMDGPAVFHFSVFKIPAVIRQALCKFNLDMDSVDLVILHQANKTMLELIYRALRVPDHKRFLFIENVGNSGGPATAVALSEAWRQGRIRPGSRTLLCSFGAGLTWGVAVIKWPEDAAPALQANPIVPDDLMLSARI